MTLDGRRSHEARHVFEIVVPDEAHDGGRAPTAPTSTPGTPAVTRATRRRAARPGTSRRALDDAGVADVVRRVLDRHGLVGPHADAEGVEVADRVSPEGVRHRFVLHHGADPVTVTSEVAGTDLLTGRRVDRRRTPDPPPDRGARPLMNRVLDPRRAVRPAPVRVARVRRHRPPQPRPARRLPGVRRAGAARDRVPLHPRPRPAVRRHGRAARVAGRAPGTRSPTSTRWSTPGCGSASSRSWSSASCRRRSRRATRRCSGGRATSPRRARTTTGPRWSAPCCGT